jgi:hypothetical protein
MPLDGDEACRKGPSVSASRAYAAHTSLFLKAVSTSGCWFEIEAGPMFDPQASSLCRGGERGPTADIGPKDNVETASTLGKMNGSN